MFNITIDKLGINLEHGITKEDFHKNEVRNAIFRIKIKDKIFQHPEIKQILNNICDFLMTEFPPYRFYNKEVCTDIQSEENYLKQIDCQIYW